MVPPDQDGTFVIDGYSYRYPTIQSLINAIYVLNEYNTSINKPYQRLAFTKNVSNAEMLEILLGVQA